MCGTGTLSHSNDAVIDSKPSGCGAWTCEEAAPARLAKLQHDLILGRADKFLTLTSVRRPGASAFEARKQMGEAVKLFMRRWRRYTRSEVAYFCVVEATKAGWPHFHILMRAKYVPQALLSEWWNELTGASRVWIEKIETARKAIKYVSKYMGKAPHKFGNSKRYFCSRNWKLPPLPGDKWKEPVRGAWDFVNEYYIDFVQNLRLRGWMRINHDVKRRIESWWRPKDINGIYARLDRRHGCIENS